MPGCKTVNNMFILLKRKIILYYHLALSPSLRLLEDWKSEILNLLIKDIVKFYFIHPLLKLKIDKFRLPEMKGLFIYKSGRLQKSQKLFTTQYSIWLFCIA